MMITTTGLPMTSSHIHTGYLNCMKFKTDYKALVTPNVRYKIVYLE